MKGIFFVLIFTAMTFLAWGAYGPTLHHGSQALGHDSLRAFVGVGLAYFVIAIVLPVVMIRTVGEVGTWTVSGIVFSLVAGAVGAVGALGIILALGFGGQAVFVMPVVFGIAPVVNTLVSAVLGRTFGQIRPIFIAGIITVALGAAGVLTFRTPGNASDASVESKADVTPVVLPVESGAAPTSGRSSTDAESAASLQQPKTNGRTTNQSHSQNHSSWQIIASMLTAALCWGSYGPMLHLGQGKMAGSRLRPFVCVGLAYFLIAVIAPLVLIYGRGQDMGTWTVSGMSWSFLAGVAGAIGALGVILAFNAGGKPHYVMPLVFGFAPVINTFISLSESGTWHLVRPLFWISLGVVISGAVTVLLTAPRSHPPKKSSPSHEPSSGPTLDNELAKSKTE